MDDDLRLERVELAAGFPDVSRLCLGTMMFGDQTDEDEARRILDLYCSHGGNFVDTADAYSAGLSEEITGRLIKDRRDQLIVATKAGNAMPGIERSGGISDRWLTQAAEDSLRRLAIDQIDIFYLHRDDEETDLAETITTLGRLIDSGKIRAWGFSNFRPWKIAELIRISDELGVDRPVVAQPYYHMLNRVVEPDFLPACHHFGLGVVSYSPLARGVLTGKYRGGVVPEGSRADRKDVRITETEFLPDTLAAAEKAAAYADGTNQSLIDLAVQWVLANKAITSILAGPRTVSQMQTYITAMGAAFGQEDEVELSALCSSGHMATPGYNDPRYPLLGRQLQFSQE